MTNREDKPSVSITFRYGAALFLLFALSCLSFWVLRENIASQKDSASIINISGRQRMLSQRIALFSLRLVNAGDELERQRIAWELKKAIELMDKSDRDLALKGRGSKISAEVSAYLNQAKSLYSAPRDNLSLDNSHLDYLLGEAENSFLRSLDSVVSRYQKESEDKIRWLEGIQAWALAATAFLLLGIGLFIFRPMAARIKKEASQLRQQSVSLVISNQKLEEEITERGLIEERLIASNEFNQRLLETIPFGLDIVDEEGTILYLNDKMESIFGKEAIDKKCYLLYKDDKKQCDNCPLKARIQDGQTKGIEVHGALNGKTFLITHTRMTYKGKKAVLEIFEDITGYRKMQEKLASSERLADMGRMAGVIAHEFRNQLGVIANAAYFLKMKVETADEKVLRHLNIIEEQVAQTEVIISNILNFSRTGSPRLEKADLGAILSRGLEKVKAPDGIEVIVNQDKLPLLDIDPVQIESVLVNIILNAFQAMGEKGSLVINVSEMGNYVNMVIKDSGKGIKDEDKKRLFEPFFSTKARGTGLGLAAAKIIIERHGGSISIDSKPEQGASVAINLPIAVKI